MNNHEEEIEILLDLNRKANEEINRKMNEIKKMKEEIVEREKRMFRLCDHTFVRDYNCMFDDLCKNYCTKCGCWNDEYMYQ